MIRGVAAFVMFSLFASPLLAQTSAPADSKQLFQLSESAVDAYLKQMQRAEPDLHKRIVAIARRNIGQPYQIYLLGESPFEQTDPEPIYCLQHSDCVVFAEHTLAMALTDNFRSFLTMLQRIRYKNGHISVLTRNHYTEADWNTSNGWLVRDITRELGAPVVATFSEKIDRARFFKNRYKLDVDLPVQEWSDSYIPWKHVQAVAGKLRDGDVVNFVSGSGEKGYVGHVGLVAIAENGSANLIHSAAPAVREESIGAYIGRMTKDDAERVASGKPLFLGFKFLRVADDPLKQLQAIDGRGAPRVTVPPQSSVTFEDYLKSIELSE